MSEGHVGRTKMIPNFETIEKIIGLCAKEHRIEVENLHAIKVVSCFSLNDTGKS